MKKLLSVFLAATMALSMAACGQAPKKEDVTVTETGIGWSALENLPAFRSPSGDENAILWEGFIPIGKNPLTVDTTVSFDVFGHPNGTLKELSPGQVKMLPDKVFENVSLVAYFNPSNKEERVIYGLDDSILHESNFMNYEKGARLTMDEIFGKGNFYDSEAKRLDVYGWDEDAPAKDNFQKIYDYFGNPSGVYWAQNTALCAATDFDAFKSLVKESGGEYRLVWDYDHCFVEMVCRDTPGKSTEMVNLTLCSKPTLKINQKFSNDVGFEGSGEYPRLTRYNPDSDTTSATQPLPMM